MIRTERTTSQNSDFKNLVALLDAELASRDGEEHGFYHQFNSITALQNVIVIYEDKEAVGCGAIKVFDTNTMEIKRMYVPVEKRGKGYATMILKALEKWAFELGHTRCVLETGKRQPEAIALYRKNQFSLISNYGPYEGVENSVCFEKNVSS